MSSIPLAAAARPRTGGTPHHRDPVRRSRSSCWAATVAALLARPAPGHPHARAACRPRRHDRRRSTCPRASRPTPTRRSALTLVRARAQQRQARAGPLLRPGVRGAAAGHACSRSRAARPAVHAAEADAGRASRRRCRRIRGPPSFSGGTKISAGLTLAHTLAVAAPGRRPTVVLVSDLSDDPRDLHATRLDPARLPARPDPGSDRRPRSRAGRRRTLPPLAQPGARRRHGAGGRRVGAASPARASPGRSSLCVLLACGALALLAALGAAARVGDDVTSRLVAAAALVALAVLALLLAADVRSWRTSRAATLSTRRRPAARRGHRIRRRRRRRQPPRHRRRPDASVARSGCTRSPRRPTFGSTTRRRCRRREPPHRTRCRCRRQRRRRGRSSQARTLLGILTFGSTASGGEQDQVDSAIADFTDAIRADDRQRRGEVRSRAAAQALGGERHAPGAGARRRLRSRRSSRRRRRDAGQGVLSRARGER